MGWTAWWRDRAEDRRVNAELRRRDLRHARLGDPESREALLELAVELAEQYEPTPYGLRRYGALLVQRGDETGSMADIEMGASWLAEALRRGADEPALASYALGLTYLAMVEHGDDPKLLEGAAKQRREEAVEQLHDDATRHLREALALGLDAPFPFADAHFRLVVEAFRRLRGDIPTEQAAIVHAQTVAVAARAAVTRPDLADDHRAPLARALIDVELYLAVTDGGSLALEWFEKLAGYAAKHPDPPPDWDAGLAVARAHAKTLHVARVTGLTPTSDFGVEDAAWALGTAQDSGPAASAFVTAAAASGAAMGDVGRLVAALELAARSDLPGDRVTVALTEMQLRWHRGGSPEDFLATMDRAVAEVTAAVAAGYSGWTTADLALPLLRNMRTAMWALARPGAPPVDEWQQPGPELRRRARAGEPAALAMIGPFEVLKGMVATTSAHALVGVPDLPTQLARLREAEDAVSRMPAGTMDRPLIAATVAHTWLRLARADAGAITTPEHAALARSAPGKAVAWFDQALDWFEGPEHPQWAMFALQAAEARRLRDGPGDRAAGRELGLRALRGHAWGVLLQSGSRHALAVARQAAENARLVAEWCAADDRAGDGQARVGMVAALEAGRGLVLHAAVTSRSAAQTLADLGHGELARQWSAAGPEPVAQGADLLGTDGLTRDAAARLAGDTQRALLRRRVLDALRGPAGRGAADLLDPPTLTEIRAALRAHRSDALVYLVAGRDQADEQAGHALGTFPGGAAPVAGPGPGRIVIVPAAESAPVEHLERPDLLVSPSSPVGRYAAAYAAWRRARGSDPDPDPDPDQQATPPPPGSAAEARDEPADPEAALAAWRAALAELTDWAGGVAGDLLRQAAGWAADPAHPRLTIVSVGALALVPWHAARLHGGTGAAAGSRLAEHAVVSYIPSARLLCRTAAAPSADKDGEVLIVGNPAGTRRTSAGADAWVLQDAFYPDATFLGRPRRPNPTRVRPSGPGTPAEVLAWLRRDGVRRAVLHLACHGLAKPTDPATSYLELAEKTPMTVGDLLADRPGAANPVDRVFLAACSTNVTGTDYDEAFSVATAFLAAGARTVYGSLWDLHAPPTSKIMFVLHDNLVTKELAPAVALQQAHCWALDPSRRAPASMPTAMVPTMAGGALALDDPAAWAGLVHLGA